MKKTLCTLKCKSIKSAVVWTILIILACRCQRKSNDDANQKGIEEPDSIMLRNVEIYSRYNPIDRWRKISNGDVLVFNNDCTVRLVCVYFVADEIDKKSFKQSMILVDNNQRHTLIEDRLPDSLMVLGDELHCVSYIKFPCFQDSPNWLEVGDSVTINVFGYYKHLQSSSSISFIYELAE